MKNYSSQTSRQSFLSPSLTHSVPLKLRIRLISKSREVKLKEATHIYSFCMQKKIYRVEYNTGGCTLSDILVTSAVLVHFAKSFRLGVILFYHATNEPQSVLPLQSTPFSQHYSSLSHRGCSRCGEWRDLLMMMYVCMLRIVIHHGSHTHMDLKIGNKSEICIVLL